MLPEKIRALAVSIGDVPQAGQLLKTSSYEFRYLNPSPDQPSVGLLMAPAERLTWQDGDLFPPMDQNLPKGDLFMRIRELFPKQPMTPMHLLALVGRNGIGRVGYGLADAPAAATPRAISKAELIGTRYTPAVFNDLVAAYLNTGAGIAGMQPKIMVPERTKVPENVWIALFDDAHRFSDRATAFIAKKGVKIATCPLVENGVVRVISSPQALQGGPAQPAGLSYVATATEPRARVTMAAAAAARSATPPWAACKASTSSCASLTYSCTMRLRN